uniref:Vomeronasal type-1 receptor n=1 Tax=Romanomermis culicivorax TaxID=13658 RepID=A0A915HVG2_ROMCU
MISCGTASCWSVDSYFATLYSHLFISIFVVLLNFGLMFLAKRLMKQALERKKTKRNLTAEEKRLSSQNHFQIKVIKTLSVMVISHATSHITSRVILLVLLTMLRRDPELTVLDHRHYMTHHMTHHSHATSHIISRVILLVLLTMLRCDPELTVLGSCARNLVVINAALHFFFYYATSSEMPSPADGNFLATTSGAGGGGNVDGASTFFRRTIGGGDTTTLTATVTNERNRGGRSKIQPLTHLNAGNLE